MGHQQEAVSSRAGTAEKEMISEGPVIRRHTLGPKSESMKLRGDHLTVAQNARPISGKAVDSYQTLKEVQRLGDAPLHRILQSRVRQGGAHGIPLSARTSFGNIPVPFEMR
jgi:hypothetical protein